MGTIDFKKLIEDTVPSASAGAHEAVVAALTQIGKQLEAGLSSARLTVSVEPGYSVNLGRQWRVVIRIPATSVEQVLFKAYIPLEGYPVTLDFYSDEPTVCRNNEEMEKEIAAFVQKPEIGSQLAELKRIAERAG